jgi:hypothetical protein
LDDLVPPFEQSPRSALLLPVWGSSGIQADPIPCAISWRLTRAPDYHIDPRLSSCAGRRIKEATVDVLRRVTQEAEKPGRLHLAIVEWQRQLIAREPQSIGRLKEPDYERLARSWSA